MTAIFISHRCTDSASAEKPETWLVEQGHERLLLDCDRKHDIPAGADWEQSLHQESRRCQAILVFLIPDWLTSKWCWAALAIIREKGKAVFVARVKPCVSGVGRNMTLDAWRRYVGKNRPWQRAVVTGLRIGG